MSLSVPWPIELSSIITTPYKISLDTLPMTVPLCNP
jgi:hypothetical protein